eukprot:Skav210626  [mRNA]  locus=scaffold234:670440:671281:- [translate_table: standard]
MALVLATLALTFATIMGMVAAAVLAYFCWNGALWLLEPNDGPAPSSMAWDPRTRPMTSWTNGSAHDLVQRVDHAGRVPMGHELAWNAHMLSSHANASVKTCQYQDLLNRQASGCAMAEEVQSPPRRSRREATPLDMSPVAVKMPTRSKAGREVSIEDLQHGYAAHFALWYALNAADVCY